MLKQLTAWLLIFSVLTVNYSRLFVYAGFKLNQNYIATRLCENRDKPLLHCNGRCYLMKKIKQAEEKQNNAECEAQKNLLQEAWCEHHAQVKFYTKLLRIVIDPYRQVALQKGYDTIFRPPQLG
jgi:hypothetical protein